MFSSSRSLRVHFGDGLARRLLVDDCAAVRVGGDEGLAREVVHHPGKAPTGLVQARERIIRKERVGASGEFEVMAHVARGLVAAHWRKGVAQ